MEFNTVAKVFLWIGFISDIVEIILMAVLMVNSMALLSMENVIIFVLCFAVAVASAIGTAALLFAHKKKGFYLMAAASVILFIINIICGTVTLKVFSKTILTILVIYFAIRNQWDELE